MRTSSCLTPIQLGPDEDNVVSPLGFDVSVTAHRQERDAAYSLLEFKRPTGRQDLPVQVHDEVEEELYILEGEATITLGQQEIKGPAGTFVCIPPGVAHRIHNTGTGSMTLLLIATPESLKQFLEELSDCMQTPGDPSPLEVLVFFLLLHLVEESAAEESWNDATRSGVTREAGSDQFLPHQSEYQACRPLGSCLTKTPERRTHDEK